jgi:hypothetical protein
VKGVKDVTLHAEKGIWSNQPGKEKVSGEQAPRAYAPGFGIETGQNLRDDLGIKDPMHVPEGLQHTTEQHTEQHDKPSEGITGSIKNTASSAATKVSETAGSAKDTVVQKVHSLQEGIANVGHSAYETTAHALLVAKDKVVDTATKAKEMVVGAPERKGSVPDASQQIPGYEKPHEGDLLGKESDKAHEGGLLGSDKAENLHQGGLAGLLKKEANDPGLHEPPRPTQAFD